MGNEVIIRQLDPQEHEKRGSLYVRDAEDAIIKSADDRELAGTVVEELNEKIKLIENEFNGTDENPGPVTLAHRTWKSGVALRDRALAGLVMAKSIWVRKVKKFEFDVEQKRLEENRKAEKIAREKAEAERQRQVEEARKLKDKESVKQLQQAPITFSVPAPKTPEIQKAEGLRRSSPEWDWELVDENQVPDRFKMLNEKAISSQVKSLGPKCGIAGINVFDKRSRAGQ